MLLLGGWRGVQELQTHSALLVVVSYATWRGSHGHTCQPWLAGCLAKFCQSHTHPGGHFSIHAWLDSTHRSHHQAYPAAQTTHTHISPAASVSLSTLRGLKT